MNPAPAENLTAHGIPSRHSNPRPACPHCASKYVKRWRDDLDRKAYECKRCHTKFYAAVLSVKPAEEVPKGSGNVALAPRGPVEIKPLVYDSMAHMRLCSERRT